MLRINQLAKELKVSNNEVLEALEKKLGISGKSHSSNLTEDQAQQLRRIFEAKHGGEGEAAPLALHKPTAAVKIVKAQANATPEPTSVPEPPSPPREPEQPIRAIVPVIPKIPGGIGALLKKVEPKAEQKPEIPTVPSPIDPEPPRATEPVPTVGATLPPEPIREPEPEPRPREVIVEAPPVESVVAQDREISVETPVELPEAGPKSLGAPTTSATLSNVLSTLPKSGDPGFTKLRVSASPEAPVKVSKPARYIQLPQTAQIRPRPEAPDLKDKPKTEPTARPDGNPAPPILQRAGQTVVQRSGMPQPEKKLLPMASNTEKGEVKHEVAQPQPSQAGKRMFIPPSITSLRQDDGFSKITVSDTPAPAPKVQEPARYIQLPQPRAPQAPASRGPQGRGPAGRPGAPGARPGGPQRPGSPRPGGAPGARPGARPGAPGSRPGGLGRPGSLAPAAPFDPNATKGPGRGAPAGKGKPGQKARYQQDVEMELKLRQPRSRAQQIATEFVDDEIGIVMLSEGVTVKELAEKCNRPAKDVVAKLLHRGIFATINQPLDTELAKEIAREFGYLADIVSFEEAVQIASEESSEAQGDSLPRPPVVTVMGHVDHGKTSLLDAIRKTKVAAGEAGGITQHIGAYHVLVRERKVVFLDTPGHEAFTKMRARGAKVTDIVVLVVAADDGVMPQTIEAINHAKAADVPIIVAINKIDKPGADPQRVMNGLLQHGIQVEAQGGDVPSVMVSAKTKQGLDELLEMILLVADLKELKAVYDCPAAGSIVEAQLDRGKGPVATVLVQRGTLKAGEYFVAGATMGRVRAMFSDRMERISEALPSSAVQILGFEEVPVAGDTFQVVASEGEARTIVGFRQEKARAAALQKQRTTLESFFSTLKEGQTKELGLIVKADVQGSVESLVSSLERLSTDKVRIRIIHSGVGTVTKNDVLLAEASDAIILAFQVKAEREAEELAAQEGVDLRYHEIIYKVTEEILAAMVGMLDKVEREVILGHVTVRAIFKAGKSVIAGCYVTDGLVKRHAFARVKRKDHLLFEGSLSSLKRFKEDVQEVKNNFECGIALEGFDGFEVDDVMEIYIKEKVAATSL